MPKLAQTFTKRKEKLGDLLNMEVLLVGLVQAFISF